MKKQSFVLLILLMLILCFAITLPASADIQSDIRVYLRRLQVEDTLRITVHGQYVTEDGHLSFSDGANLTVVLRGDKLVLHTGQTAMVMGNSLKLVRCESTPSGYLLLNDNTGMYEGDLSLDISNNAIRPILNINVEDYLLGVVLFEMGDSFPLEALKAQAVTARTYALRKSGSSGAYDVEDFAGFIAVRLHSAFIQPAMAVKPNWGSTSGQIPTLTLTVIWICGMTHMTWKTKTVLSSAIRLTKSPEKRGSEPRCIKLL